jgi:hypothetical protein
MKEFKATNDRTHEAAKKEEAALDFGVSGEITLKEMQLDCTFALAELNKCQKEFNSLNNKYKKIIEYVKNRIAWIIMTTADLQEVIIEYPTHDRLHYKANEALLMRCFLKEIGEVEE